ncbi:hypothetical protein L6164_022757 [Bauhinia variegata]|uniref:Uncharacterized protein n=1 Tax=Bauhinia variegata TaxID=167791 RepID=A0ACB9MG79_BAUVA|nr:hypothetical protein L6164_022757 [Bauhinia variegata]
MKIIIKLFAFAIVLLLLFFSTGDRVSATNVCVKPLPIAAGNIGLKWTEARECEAPLDPGSFNCDRDQCDGDCKFRYGNHAYGLCDAIEDCICHYPCHVHPS